MLVEVRRLTTKVEELLTKMGSTHSVSFAVQCVGTWFKPLMCFSDLGVNSTAYQNRDTTGLV